MFLFPVEIKGDVEDLQEMKDLQSKVRQLRM